VGFIAGWNRFAVFLAFFCNTQRYSGVIQNGDVLTDSPVSVGLPENGKQKQTALMDG